MRVRVEDLEFVNIGQTVEFKPEQSEDLDVPLHVMGRLEAVELHEDGYFLVVGGEGYPMQGKDMIEMFRSVELHHIKQLSDDVTRLAREVRDAL